MLSLGYPKHPAHTLTCRIPEFIQALWENDITRGQNVFNLSKDFLEDTAMCVFYGPLLCSSFVAMLLVKFRDYELIFSL